MSDDIEPTDPRTARRRDPEGVQTDAWKRTLEEMDVIAEDRRADGWSVFTLLSGQTDTVSRDMGEDDKFGLVHVIPDNYADDLVELYDSDEFTEYLAYGRDLDGFMYAVIEFIDPDEERSILLACRYDMAMAQGMVNSVLEEGVLYSHFKTIDGTILGSFEHEEYEPLVERPSA